MKLHLVENRSKVWFTYFLYYSNEKPGMTSISRTIKLTNIVYQVNRAWLAAWRADCDWSLHYLDGETFFSYRRNNFYFTFYWFSVNSRPTCHRTTTSCAPTDTWCTLPTDKSFHSYHTPQAQSSLWPQVRMPQMTILQALSEPLIKGKK